MNRIIILLVIAFTYAFNIQAKELYFPLLNTRDTCQDGSRLWLLDNNDDNKFDFLVYAGCNQNGKIYSLIDKSDNIPLNKQSAILISGNFYSNNFLIYLIDIDNTNYTHKIYFDSKFECVILEDFSGIGEEPTTYEEADNFFYTQQIGSTLLITKKVEIDVQSVMLCGLDGSIITNLQQVSGWSQYSFDLFSQSSSIYILRFIATDKTLTKKIIYLR